MCGLQCVTLIIQPKKYKKGQAWKKAHAEKMVENLQQGAGQKRAHAPKRMPMSKVHKT